MNDINELIELVFAMSRLTKEGLESEEGAPSYVQLQALFFISNQSDPIMRDLAKHLNIRPSSTTFLVNNLIKLHLVSRITDSHDKRIVRLSISKKGKKELKTGLMRSKKHLRRKLSLLSDKERHDLISILKKLSILVNNK